MTSVPESSDSPSVRLEGGRSVDDSKDHVRRAAEADGSLMGMLEMSLVIVAGGYPFVKLDELYARYHLPRA